MMPLTADGGGIEEKQPKWCGHNIHRFCCRIRIAGQKRNCFSQKTILFDLNGVRVSRKFYGLKVSRIHPNPNFFHRILSARLGFELERWSTSSRGMTNAMLWMDSESDVSDWPQIEAECLPFIKLLLACMQCINFRSGHGRFAKLLPRHAWQGECPWRNIIRYPLLKRKLSSKRRHAHR